MTNRNTQEGIKESSILPSFFCRHFMWERIIFAVHSHEEFTKPVAKSLPSQRNDEDLRFIRGPPDILQLRISGSFSALIHLLLGCGQG